MKHTQMAHTVANVQSNADKITNFAIDKLQHLIDAAAATLPKATHYALETVGIQCLINVLDWCVFFPILLVLACLCVFFLRKATGYQKENRYDDGSFGWWLGGIITGILSVIVFGATLANIPYWSFIGINHPDLYVVHLALDKVLN